MQKNKPAPKSVYIPLTHTNSIPLDSWSISRDSTTPLGSLCVHRPCQGSPTIPLVSLCVHRDAITIPLGSLCVHRDVPAHKPPITMPPTTFLPHPGFYIFILHILQETARPSACARQVRGSILRNFCRPVAYLCHVVSLRQQSGRGAPASRYSPDLKQCIHQLVRIFGPELIRINELIKTAGGGTSCKILKTLVAAPASKFRKRDISSASEKAFPDFFGH